MKVLLGLEEIAGYCRSLKIGFQENGVDCTFLNLYDNPFQYGGEDTPNKLVQWTKRCNRIQLQTKKKPIKLLFFLAVCILRFVLFWWALLKFDAFIFCTGKSFFLFDMPILRLFGKRVICVYLGTDSRPPYLNGVATSSHSIDQIITLTRRKKMKIKWEETWASYVVNYIPQAHFHEKKFVLGDYIGFPCLMPAVLPNIDKIQDRPVTIVHSPSRPTIKGTLEIERIIAELIADGHNINFIKVINQPNYMVHAQLANCDFVIDEIYSDLPIAGLSTEAALWSTPVIVGGYYANYKCTKPTLSDKGLTLFCGPDNLRQAILQFIQFPEMRREIGERANHYVCHEVTPKAVAQRYLRIINNNVPKEWYYNPWDIHYLHGYGMSEEKAKQTIRLIVERSGRSALQLSDKPHLEDLFVNFAKEKNKKEYD